MDYTSFAALTESLEGTVNVPNALIAAGLALLTGIGIFIMRHRGAHK